MPTMAKQPKPTTEPLKSRKALAPKSPQTVERVAKTTAPKPRQDVGLSWLVLAGLLVLAAIPLLLDLRTPGIWSEQEALYIAISAETRQRKAPLADAQTSLQSWTPVYHGESRWDLPPGGTWLNLVMYLGIPEDQANTLAFDDQVWITRARLGSVVMALLLVASIFWAGHSLGGLTTATLSTLIAMTMPLVIGYGRFSNPHIAAAGLSALSIAGALWAMRPLRAAPSLIRQLVGWVVCGTGLGLSTLTLGPTAVPGTLICTIVLAMFCPRRFGHIMGLLASTSLACLILMPWAMHVHTHDPDVWQQWLGRLAPDLGTAGTVETLTRAGWRLALFAAVSGLWAIWLLPALIQPFSTSTGNARRKLLLGWSWLVVALGLVAFAPGSTRYAGLLIVVAPACVATGLIIQHFRDLSAEGRHARLWLIGRWITCGSMIALALTLPLLGYLLRHQPQWVAWLSHIEPKLLATMHWSFYAGAGVALLLAAILATRFAINNHPGRTIGCMAIWLLIVMSLTMIPLARGQRLNTTYQAPQAEILSNHF